jgi:hypothetical protein
MSVEVLRGVFKLMVVCSRNRKIEQFFCFVLRVGARGWGISRVECYKNEGEICGYVRTGFGCIGT